MDGPQLSCNQLEERIRSGVTLIGFESPGSPPCRDQKAIIESLSRRFKNEARIIDVNIDDYRQFAIRLGITSIPTLIIFKNGAEIRRFVGLQRDDILSRAIQKVLR
jgi:thioredoxin 1